MALPDSLVKGLAKLFAPQSLAAINEDYLLNSPDVLKELNKNVRKVQPGDIIFTSTPGPFFWGIRSLASSRYDHIVTVFLHKKRKNFFCVLFSF
jgi:hypothetical protein